MHKPVRQTAFLANAVAPMRRQRARPITSRRPSAVRTARCSVDQASTDGNDTPFAPRYNDPDASSSPAPDASSSPAPDGLEAHDCLPVELVDGYLDNAKVRPKIDIDADEYMLMWKLRKMLHEDDFNRIFDVNSHKIGEM